MPNRQHVLQHVADVHAHQRRLGQRDRAAHHGDMDGVVDGVLVGDQPELAELGLHVGLGDALDGVLVVEPVADEIGDGADLQAVLLGEGFEVRPARHGAVVAQDLADHRRRRAAGETGEVAAGLGMAGAVEHAAVLRHQRKDVAGLHDVLGTRVGLHRGAHGVRAVVRGDAGGDALRSLDGDGEVGAEAGAVVAHHQRQAQRLALLLREREADQAAAEAGHEVDVLRPHGVGAHEEVALVLAVLVVHEDHHLAGAQVGDDLGDAVQAAVQLVGRGLHMGIHRLFSSSRAASRRSR